MTLAEAGRALGGRINGESGLPGMASYGRVRDYREGLLRQMANVSIYLDSALGADAVLDLGAPHVFVATGSRWRRDGTGRSHYHAIPGLSAARALTPDDVMAGERADGRVVVFDDDHYLMGGLVAEHLVDAGHPVTLVTPAALVSAWTENTLEQERIQTRLMQKDVEIIANHNILEIADGAVRNACVFTGKTATIPCQTIVPVTARDPVDGLYRDLAARRDAGAAPQIKTLEAIGDCLAPGTVASAVYLGHLAARCLEGEAWDKALYRRERPSFREEMPAFG